ncbi:PQQ-binding-like beta-propeller repeat protein [Kutzneria sp. NPDC052558]|uniref:Vgb family protein n=1 Tax=Kutzneria sp. NPDC052558 TaxID=3364121 RepID=UPI0037C921CD
MPSRVRLIAAAVGLGLLVLPATASAATATPPKCPSTSCQALLTGISDAYSVALDGHGAAFVSYWEGRVDRVDLATGRAVTLATDLGNLRGVATDGAGTVYVTDFNGSVIQVDVATGAHRVTASGLGGGLMAVTYGNGHVYAGTTYGQLWEITAGQPRSVTGKVGMIADLAFGRDGGVYVAEIGGSVSRVDVATGAVRILATDQYEPQSVQVAANGTVYFAAAGELHSIDPATGKVSPNIVLGHTDNLWDFAFGDTTVALESGTLWKITGYAG